MKFYLHTSLAVGLALACLPTFAGNWIHSCAKNDCSLNTRLNQVDGFEPVAFEKFAEKYGLIIDGESETHRPVGQKTVPLGTKNYFLAGGRLAYGVLIPHMQPKSTSKNLEVGKLDDAKNFCNELINIGRYTGKADNAKPEDSYLYASGWAYRAIAVGFRTAGNNLKYYYCPNPYGYVGDAE